MTLALLLTAVTGAWATDGVKLTTTEIVPPAAWNKDYTYLLPSDMPGLKADAITEEQAKAWADVPKSGNVDLIYGYVDAGNYIDFKIISFIDGQVNSSNSRILSHNSVYIDNVKYYYATGVVEPDFKWDAATKTGTFTMPAFDVEIAPIYAPVAQWAKVENMDQLPTAIEGIYAESTDAIVKAGTVAKIGDTENPQGIVMYAVTSINQATAPALSAFSADVPTAKDITAAGDVKVWYYIKGADTPEGETATAENTFNDSEICETPITVTVLSNKFDITFKAANDNTIEAGKATVTVGGKAPTTTVTEGKLEGVKMGTEVKLKASEGYKFRKVEAKKNRVAEGHALTSAKFGEIVCSDGKAYAAADKDILPKGVKAEALVCYVDGNGHGLALAMADVKNEKMSWDTERGANDGKTAAEWCTGWNTSHPITGATWLLASQTQWNNMINAAGSASNLSNAFSAVGGTNLQAYSYWSSTPHLSGTAAWFYYFPSSSWQWTYLNQDETGRYIRACLEW